MDWKQGLREWVCDWIGHQYDSEEMFVFSMKLEAENRDQLKGELRCKMCRQVIKLSNGQTFTFPHDF